MNRRDFSVPGNMSQRREKHQDMRAATEYQALPSAACRAFQHGSCWLDRGICMESNTHNTCHIPMWAYCLLFIGFLAACSLLTRLMVPQPPR